jgi:PadR family transcriptional regulator, regulatory protein PadR
VTRGGQWLRRLTCATLFNIVEEMNVRTHLGEFELMVLLVVLRLGEGAYGVPIAREIEKETGREVRIGSVYAALDRLQRKGLVSSTIGEPTPERGGRAKRYFQVTGLGLRQVRQTQRTLVALWSGLPELERGIA